MHHRTQYPRPLHLWVAKTSRVGYVCQRYVFSDCGVVSIGGSLAPVLQWHHFFVPLHLVVPGPVFAQYQDVWDLYNSRFDVEQKRQQQQKIFVVPNIGNGVSRLFVQLKKTTAWQQCQQWQQWQQWQRSFRQFGPNFDHDVW